jgi:lipoprotein-releasing system permease protein
MPTIKHYTNIEIAFTYIFKNKKMSLVAALGVVLGIAVFIFMNSLLSGFNKQATDAFFKSIPHIRIYKDDIISKPLFESENKKTIIINPKIVPTTNQIDDPKNLIEFLKKQKEVTVVTPQITTSVFFNSAKSQISGRAIGIIPEEAKIMFDMPSFIVDGSVDDLKHNINGIILGSGIANKMNVSKGDNISMTSSIGVTKIFKIVAIFKTNNSIVDKTTSYINLAYAQEILKENNTYITDINVNIKDYNNAVDYSKYLQQLINYKVEDWQAANETYMAGNRMRAIIIRFVSYAILLVAGFGIYNILNMTVMQKINDIAILKAMGFNGKDVVRIFVSQALIIGFIGVLFGTLVAAVLVGLMQQVYVGGDIGYFPIYYSLDKFILGIAFGLFVTFLAGYIPARKAANIDPVEILRK